MKTKLIFACFLLLTGIGLLWLQMPAAASPLGQSLASPTPGSDGRITYFVQAGDTCERLSLLYGVSVDYIRTANLLDENCTLREGQSIVLGIAEPATATPTPGGQPTSTPEISPTPTTAVGGSAEICVLVYGDVNGDALRQETEVAIAGAAISLIAEDGTYSQDLTSSINPDPEAYQGMCFENVPPGKYNVSAAAPDVYNPTTALAAGVEVVPGETAYVDFGAQSKTAAEASNPRRGPSPLLGVVGAAFLLGGVGLGVYVWRMLRKK